MITAAGSPCRPSWRGCRRSASRRPPLWLDRATATRRLIGMLARKGYGGGLAAAVVREALDGVDAADAEVDVEFDALAEDALLP